MKLQTNSNRGKNASGSRQRKRLLLGLIYKLMSRAESIEILIKTSMKLLTRSFNFIMKNSKDWTPDQPFWIIRGLKDQQVCQSTMNLKLWRRLKSILKSEIYPYHKLLKIPLKVKKKIKKFFLRQKNKKKEI